MAQAGSSIVSGIGLLLVLVACDERSECGATNICIGPPRFQQAQIIGAWPARVTAEGAVAVCDGSHTDAVIVNALLLSTQRGTVGSEPEFDLSIRPGDGLDNRLVEGSRADDIHFSDGAISLVLDCINRVDAGTTACEGLVPERRDDISVRYTANTAARSVGHDVVVLVDLSADAAVAGILRASAARLVRMANPRDDVSIVGFGERLVVCTVDNGIGEAITCDEMPNAPIHPRSNLWQAVASAYDSLRTRPSDAGRAKHIIVLANGPDTCAGEDRANCSTPCSTADPRDLAARVARDRKDTGLTPIHIDFVQLETDQHPGRDARQVALACASGGHYQFIDSSTIPWTGDALREAVNVTVANARYAWEGHWELALPLPAYDDRAALPPGVMYALQGVLEVGTKSNLVKSDRHFPFGVGLGLGAPSAFNWDRRPTLLKPCGGPSDCGIGPASACNISCSGETGLCPTEGALVPRPDLSTCGDEDGTPGFCCDGDCRFIGQCEACNMP